jgi:hypothetical protein
MTWSGAIITLLGTALTGIVTLLATPVGQKILAKRMPQRMGVALDAGPKLSDLCRKFVNFPGIKKAVIVQTNNGGGIPHPGSILYATITYPEEFRDNLKNQPLDAEHASYVAQAYKDGSCMIQTLDLKDDGLLKALFEAQQIESCEVISMKKYPEKLFTLAIDYTDYELIHNNAYAKEELRKLIQEISIVMNE